MGYRIPPLRIEVGWDGAVAAVTISGELDITSAPCLKERLLEVAAARPERLVLDMSGLVFLDTAARALDTVHRALEAGCPVTIRDPRPAARRVFRVAGLMED
jgi:anti-anti-sigma factor